MSAPWEGVGHLFGSFFSFPPQPIFSQQSRKTPCHVYTIDPLGCPLQIAMFGLQCSIYLSIFRMMSGSIQSDGKQLNIGPKHRVHRTTCKNATGCQATSTYFTESRHSHVLFVQKCHPSLGPNEFAGPRSRIRL